jgi:hypothetical protein
MEQVRLAGSYVAHSLTAPEDHHTDNLKYWWLWCIQEWSIVPNSGVAPHLLQSDLQCGAHVCGTTSTPTKSARANQWASQVPLLTEQLRRKQGTLPSVCSNAVNFALTFCLDEVFLPFPY